MNAQRLSALSTSRSVVLVRLHEPATRRAGALRQDASQDGKGGGAGQGYHINPHPMGWEGGLELSGYVGNPV